MKALKPLTVMQHICEYVFMFLLLFDPFVVKSLPIKLLKCFTYLLYLVHDLKRLFHSYHYSYATKTIVFSNHQTYSIRSNFY